MSRRWSGLAAMGAAVALAACATASPSAGPSGTPTAGASPSLAGPATRAPATATLGIESTPAATLAPTQTLLPTFTPAPTATPAARLHQLTSGGCCVQPFWSADGQQVRFIDRPSSGQPAGIWAVSLTGGAPILVASRLGIYSRDETLVAYLEGDQTYVERVGGPRWLIPSGGRAVSFSPDSTQIAWQAASSLFNFDRRRVAIWVAQVDGSGARSVAALVGGSLVSWFPDGRRLLVTSHDGNQTQVQALNIADGVLSPLATVPRLQDLALSPGGGWLAYVVAFSGDPSLDGLWVTPVGGEAGNGGSAAPARRLDVFGGFAWRSEGRLLVIPLDATATNNRVVEVDAASGAERTLVDPAITPFQIAQGNWALSPDGSRLAFVSAADHNIWVLDLTE